MCWVSAKWVLLLSCDGFATNDQASAAAASERESSTPCCQGLSSSGATFHGPHFHRWTCLFWEMPWLRWEVGFRKCNQEKKGEHTVQPSLSHPQQFFLSSPNADQPYPKSLAHYLHSKQYATIQREAGVLATQFRKKNKHPPRSQFFRKVEQWRCIWCPWQVSLQGRKFLSLR